MSKVTLLPAASIDNSLIANINTNNATITTAFDNTLSRNGQSPNQMQSIIDMNNNAIINLPNAVAAGQPITFGQLVNIPTSLPIINVTASPYNADPTGIKDSTSAIQNAINALPVNGGTIAFPIGTYTISSTINIGNGSSSAASTQQGVVLVGLGNPNTNTLLQGMVTSSGVRFIWAGFGTASMIAVKGPLQGWGIQNISLDGQSIAGTTGISVISAQYGDVRNVSIQNCPVAGIKSSTVPIFGSLNNTDSIRNVWQNITVKVPSVSSAIGIFLTGNGIDTTSDTDYNTFSNVDIILPLTPATITTGISLQCVDSIMFFNVHMYGGNASTTSVVFDYTFSNTFPSSNMFYALDPGNPSRIGTLFANVGSPGSFARPNYIYGLVEANQATNPQLANLSPALPARIGPGVSLTGQTAAIGTTNVNQPPDIFFSGMYRWTVYLLTTAAGTGGNETVSLTVSWTDEATTHTAAAIGPISLTTLGAFAVGGTTAHLAAGSNFTYFTTIAGSGTTGFQYAVYIRMERLD